MQQSRIGKLQEKLDQKLENGYPPDAPTLADVVNVTIDEP